MEKPFVTCQRKTIGDFVCPVTLGAVLSGAFAPGRVSQSKSENPLGETQSAWSHTTPNPNHDPYPEKK